LNILEYPQSDTRDAIYAFENLRGTAFKGRPTIATRSLIAGLALEILEIGSLQNRVPRRPETVWRDSDVRKRKGVGRRQARSARGDRARGNPELPAANLGPVQDTQERVQSLIWEAGAADLVIRTENKVLPLYDARLHSRFGKARDAVILH